MTRVIEGREMKIVDIKKKIAEWEDFYGQDIAATDEIGKCRTKADCRKVLENHRRFLEEQNCDAMQHLDEFEREIGC